MASDTSRDFALERQARLALLDSINKQFTLSIADAKCVWETLPKNWTWNIKTNVVIEAELALKLAIRLQKPSTPEAVRKRRFNLISSRARALLLAFNSLDLDDALGFGKALEGEETLNRWITVVREIESQAQRQGNEITPNKTNKPSLENQRMLLRMIHQSVVKGAGILPPKSKETWFPQYAQCLALVLNEKIGADLVDAVVSKANQFLTELAVDDGHTGFLFVERERDDLAAAYFMIWGCPPSGYKVVTDD